MFAVVGRAPLTAILLVFEVTGARDYQLILPLMLTATWPPSSPSDSTLSPSTRWL